MRRIEPTLIERLAADYIAAVDAGELSIADIKAWLAETSNEYTQRFDLLDSTDTLATFADQKTAAFTALYWLEQRDDA